MEQLIIGVFEQGFIYAIMALGVYITYKILDFPDLSVDSTFPLGAAVTTVMLSSGKNPLLALIAATAAGAIAGMVTGIIHVKFKVRDLLSGIIVMTGLYTLNLRIVGGSANVPLFNYKSVFDNDFINGIFPEALAPYKTVIIIFIIMIIAKILLDLYLKTKSGYLLRAVGDNETIVTSLAKDSGFVKIVGLAISNGLVALAGSVMCQQQRFFEISMGTGTIVIGLASVTAAAAATDRSSAFSRTKRTYSSTLAEVGVTSISWARYARVPSLARPAFSSSPATVRPSMGRE